MIDIEDKDPTLMHLKTLIQQQAKISQVSSRMPVATFTKIIVFPIGSGYVWKVGLNLLYILLASIKEYLSKLLLESY